MNKFQQEPVVVGHAKRESETVEMHPAYGQIGASRVSSGGGEALYGSDFVHHHFVMIEIHESELHRTLSRDWPFARKELIRVSLSEAQWARFVSALNTGDMAQCTLERVAGQEVPGIPEPPDRAAQFQGEMSRDLGRAVEALQTLKERIASVNMSVKARDEIRALANTAERAISDGAPFVAKQFNEHMEVQKERARVEINAHVQATITRAGLKSLGGDGQAVPFELPSHTDSGEREEDR